MNQCQSLLAYVHKRQKHRTGGDMLLTRRCQQVPGSQASCSCSWPTSVVLARSQPSIGDSCESLRLNACVASFCEHTQRQAVHTCTLFALPSKHNPFHYRFSSACSALTLLVWQQEGHRPVMTFLLPNQQHQRTEGTSDRNY